MRKRINGTAASHSSVSCLCPWIARAARASSTASFSRPIWAKWNDRMAASRAASLDPGAIGGRTCAARSRYSPPRAGSPPSSRSAARPSSRSGASASSEGGTMLRSSGGGRPGSRKKSGTTRSWIRVSARSTCPAARKWRAARRVSPAEANHSAARTCRSCSRAASLARSSARSTWRTRWWYRKVVRSSSTATRNRFAASMRRSSTAASCRPVTAVHAAAVSSPRTEESSMNRATSGDC